MSHFCVCPKCGSDLRDGLVSEEFPTPCRFGCDQPSHYSRLVGIYDYGLDRTVEWMCPDCGGRWPR